MVTISSSYVILQNSPFLPKLSQSSRLHTRTSIYSIRYPFRVVRTRTKPIQFTIFSAAQTDAQKQEVDIVIVGAGIAGLASAVSLYREKMGIYTTEVRKLGIEIFGAIMMSLGLEKICSGENFEQGMHIMGVNSYPPSSQSNLKMGIAEHSDHSIITILLQSHPGLQIMDCADATWKAVPELNGSLQVLVGDHLEGLSNGLYKSVLHWAIPSSKKTRLSLASLHSLGMDEIVEPAMKLVDEKHPKGCKGTSLKDFLMHLSSRQEKSFIETLQNLEFKINILTIYTRAMLES